MNRYSRPTLRSLFVAAATLTAAALAAGPAQALDNAPADTKNRFPNVGALVIIHPLVNVPEFDDVPVPWIGGTGTLIDSRTMLVAGHSVLAIEQAIAAGNSLDDLRVSFDTDAYNPPSWIEVQAFAKHPGFLDAKGNRRYTDVGVLILKTPVTGIAPVPLPQPYFLDMLLESGGLSHGNDDPTLLTVVGYGKQSEDQVRADGVRYVGIQGFYNLRDVWVYCSNHENRGYCISEQGDSGGPLVWTDPRTGAGYLVAVNSGWNNLETFARVDLPEVLDWLEGIMEDGDW